MKWNSIFPPLRRSQAPGEWPDRSTQLSRAIRRSLRDMTHGPSAPCHHHKGPRRDRVRISSVKPGKTLLWLIKASNLRPLIIGSGAARGWPCRRVQRYVVRHNGRFARQGTSDSASGTPVAEMEDGARTNAGEFTAGIRQRTGPIDPTNALTKPIVGSPKAATSTSRLMRPPFRICSIPPILRC